MKNIIVITFLAISPSPRSTCLIMLLYNNYYYYHYYYYMLILIWQSLRNYFWDNISSNKSSFPWQDWMSSHKLTTQVKRQFYFSYVYFSCKNLTLPPNYFVFFCSNQIFMYRMYCIYLKNINKMTDLTSLVCSCSSVSSASSAAADKWKMKMLTQSKMNYCQLEVVLSFNNVFRLRLALS